MKKKEELKDKVSPEMFSVALAEVQKKMTVKELKLFENIMVNADPKNSRGEVKLNKKKLIRSLWPDLTDDKKIGKQHYLRLKETMHSMQEKLSKIGEHIESEYLEIEFEEDFFNQIVEELRENEENQMAENKT